MNKVGKYFDSWADGVPNIKELPYFVRWLFDKIVENIEPSDGKTILDLGTGNGILIRRLQIENPKMKFIDIDASEAMIRMARKLTGDHGTEFRIGNMEHTDLPNESMDYVVSNQAVHHVKNKLKLLKEVHRILKKKGRVVISDHFEPESDGESELEYRRHLFEKMKNKNKEISEFAKSYMNSWEDLTEEQMKSHPPEYHLLPKEFANIMSKVGFRSKVVESPIKCVAVVVGEKY
jgi:ubiquinone/menaquinone biosynthesis C-methylase UbiE